MPPQSDSPARADRERPILQRLFGTLKRNELAAPRNQRLLLADAFGTGLAFAVQGFLSVFLVRLGATDALVGMLTALPALVGMLISAPAGEFLRRQPDIASWYAKSRLAAVSFYVLTGLAPFVFMRYLPEVIIAIAVVATIPQTLAAVSITVIVSTVAGPGGRLALAGKRWPIMSLTNMLAVAAIGWVLTVLHFPVNYQVIFISSLLGGLIAYHAASRIDLPHAQVESGRISPLATLRDIRHSLGDSKPFVRFTVSQFLWRIGALLPLPLYAIYWVRHVEASDAAISLISSARIAMTIVSYFIWTRASQRISRRSMLLVSSLGICLYPLLTSLTLRPQLLALWGGLDGFFAAGFNLAFYDILMSTSPPGHETTYVGLYQTTVSLALFIGPLVGTSLSGIIGIESTLIAGSALGFVGVVIMVLLGAGKPGPSAPGERATAASA